MTTSVSAVRRTSVVAPMLSRSHDRYNSLMEMILPPRDVVPTGKGLDVMGREPVPSASKISLEDSGFTEGLPSGHVFEMDGALVTQALLINNGCHMLTAGTEALVWDMESGKVTHRLGQHSRPIVGAHEVSAAGEGFSLATHTDKTVYLWDFGGSSIKSLHTVAPCAEEGVLSFVQVTPQGRYLVVGTMMANQHDHMTISTWDIRANKRLYSLSMDGVSMQVLWCAVSGSVIVTLVLAEEDARDDHIITWDLEDGSLRHCFKDRTFGYDRLLLSDVDPNTLVAHAGFGMYEVICVESGRVIFDIDLGDEALGEAFSVSGNYLLSYVQEDRSAHAVAVVSMKTGQRLLSLGGYCTGPVVSAVMTPDEKHIFVSHKGSTIRAWRVKVDGLASAECYSEMNTQGLDPEMSLSRDSSVLALKTDNGAQIELWWVNGFRHIRTIREHRRHGVLKSFMFTPDSRRVITCSSHDILSIHDIADGHFMHRLRGHDDNKLVRAAALSPSRQVLATGSQDNSVRLWNVRSGSCMHVLDGHTKEVRRVCFTPCGTRVISGSWDGTARIWDTETGECVHILSGHMSIITRVQAAYNGAFLATASFDKTARLWCLDSGKCLHILRHDQSIRALAISMDSSRVVTGSHDTNVIIWDSATGACLRCLVGHTSFVWNVIVTQDDQHIVSSGCDGVSIVWSFDSDDPQCKLNHEPNTRVVGPALTRNGKTIVTGSTDQTVRLWDLETGKCRLVLRGHTSGIWDVIMVPYSPHVVSVGLDGSMRLWDTTDGTCLFASEGANLNGSTVGEMACFSDDGFTSSCWVVCDKNDVWVFDSFSINAIASRLWISLGGLGTVPHIHGRMIPTDSIAFNTGKTIMHVAAENGCVDALSFLLSNDDGRLCRWLSSMDASSSSVSPVNVLQAAIMEGHKDTVLVILKSLARVPASERGVLRTCWAMLAKLHPDLVVEMLGALPQRMDPRIIRKLDKRAHIGSTGLIVCGSESTGPIDICDERMWPAAVTPKDMSFPMIGVTPWYSGLESLAGFNARISDSILHCLVDTNNVEAIGTAPMRAVLQFKWERYARSYFLFNFCIYLGFLFLYLSYGFFWETVQSEIHPALGVCFSFVLLVCVLYFLQIELRQMIMYRSDYLLDPWNWIESSAFFSTILVIVLTEGRSDQASAWNGITSMMLWMRTLSFARGFQGTGIFAKTFFKVIQDAKYFLMLLVFLLLGFGGGIFLIQNSINDEFHSTEAFGSITSAVFTLYLAIFSNFNASDFSSGHFDTLTTGLLVLYLFIIQILWMNLLVAMLFKTYTSIEEDAYSAWLFERACLIKEIEDLLAHKQIMSKKCEWFPRHLHMLADRQAALIDKNIENGEGTPSGSARRETAELAAYRISGLERSIGTLQELTEDKLDWIIGKMTSKRQTGAKKARAVEESSGPTSPTPSPTMLLQRRRLRSHNGEAALTPQGFATSPKSPHRRPKVAIPRRRWLTRRLSQG